MSVNYFATDWGAKIEIAEDFHLRVPFTQKLNCFLSSPDMNKILKNTFKGFRLVTVAGTISINV